MRRERLMQALQTQHAEAQSALLAAEPASGAGAAGAMTGLAGGVPMGISVSGANAAAAAGSADGSATFVRGDRKMDRNEPCPCGSGKKFKHCHGALSGAE